MVSAQNGIIALTKAQSSVSSQPTGCTCYQQCWWEVPYRLVSDHLLTALSKETATVFVLHSNEYCFHWSCAQYNGQVTSLVCALPNTCNTTMNTTPCMCVHTYIWHL
eukprot:scpid17014/ scgid19872/ 